MPVNCPHCSTRYVLPEALLGPGGARVRCPRCREPFAVGPDGVAVPPPNLAAVAPAADDAGAPSAAASHSLAPSELDASSRSEAHAPSTGEASAPSTSEAHAPSAGEASAPSTSEAHAPATGEASAPSTSEAHAGNGTPVAAVPGEIRPAGPPRLPSVARAPARANAEAASSSAAESPDDIARSVLDELAAHSGDAIAASRAQGRLFREFGAVIAEAFEFYRRRVGPPADPAPFRAVLRERWGVDLEPGDPPKRLI